MKFLKPLLPNLWVADLQKAANSHVSLHQNLHLLSVLATYVILCY